MCGRYTHHTAFLPITHFTNLLTMADDRMVNFQSRVVELHNTVIANNDVLTATIDARIASYSTREHQQFLMDIKPSLTTFLESFMLPKRQRQVLLREFFISHFGFDPKNTENPFNTYILCVNNIASLQLTKDDSKFMKNEAFYLCHNKYPPYHFDRLNQKNGNVKIIRGNDANVLMNQLPKQNPFGDDACPICLDNVIENSMHVIVTNCSPHNHVYHTECYLSYVDQLANKPLNCLVCTRNCNIKCSGLWKRRPHQTV